MTNTPWKTHWNGVPIDTLSREELIEALEWCAEEFHRMYANDRRESEILDRFRAARGRR